MKKKRRRRPNSGFLGVQDSRRPLFVVDLMGEGESSALPFTGLVGEREGESGSAEGIVLMPGCYDALSTAIVQKSGFSVGLISGYALSASLLGKPDFGLLTQSEMAEKARFICASPQTSQLSLMLEHQSHCSRNFGRDVIVLLPLLSMKILVEVMLSTCKGPCRI